MAGFVTEEKGTNSGVVGAAGGGFDGTALGDVAKLVGTGGPVEAGTLSDAGTPVPFGGNWKGTFSSDETFDSVFGASVGALTVGFGLTDGS